jgi:hypothetical protein
VLARRGVLLAKTFDRLRLERTHDSAGDALSPKLLNRVACSHWTSTQAGARYVSAMVSAVDRAGERGMLVRRTSAIATIERLAKSTKTSV